MDRLNWTGFDGKRFQSLCNSLLLFEVSKFAHVFRAEGRDDGIDQYFQGTYSNKTGKWRFQDKFHNSGDKRADIAELKRDIVRDIKDNYNGENFIVLLTNINLTKGKFYDLLKLADATIKGDAIENCEFILWHEPAIESLISNNQIVYNWYWEIDTILMQPPSVYFNFELDSENNDLRYQLHNDFFGREQFLETLNQFLDLRQSTLAVVANGGFGKTRLCIEYFKLLEGNEEWIPLVLYHSGYNASHLFQLLKTKKRLLVFIDDAHEIPTIVGDVKKLIDASKGKHKLLLTTRNTLFTEIIEKIPSRSRDIIRLDLDKLSYSETKQMFLQALPFLKEKEIISLSNSSKGVPNVILEFIRLIKNGKQPYEISNEISFAESVFQIFSEAAESVEKELFIPKEKTNDFVKLVSIISPLRNNIEDKTFISNVIGIETYKIEQLIGHLSNLSLLNKNGIAIKPDSYSDTILVQTIKKNKDFIEFVRNQEGAGIYFENILKNLAEAEITENDRSLFIENLLSGYVELIEQPDTETVRIKAILEFANKIFYTNPHTAALAISYFLEIYKDPDNKIHYESDAWQSKSYKEMICDEVDKIFENLFSYTAYVINNLDTMHQMLEEYLQHTGHFALIGQCYGYRESDLEHYGYPRQCCERQLFLANVVSKYLQNCKNEFPIKVSLEASKKLLELDFHLDSYYEEETHQIHYGIGRVLKCIHTTQIRSKIINAFINFYSSFSGAESFKETVLQELLNYFFYCSENYHQRFSYEFDKEEIETVLNYFKAILEGNPSTKAKNKILSTANLYGRKEFNTQFADTIEDIKLLAAKVNSLYEELELLLINEDFIDVRNNLETKLTDHINKYVCFEDFQQNLICVSKTISTTTNLQQALRYLASTYPVRSKSLFTIIQGSHQELIPDFVFLVTANYQDKKYFYETVERLWQERKHYVYQVFWLLTFGRKRDKNYYEPEDLNYFRTALDENLEQAYSFMACDLLDYAYKDKRTAFDLLLRFLENASFNNLIYFVLQAFDDKETYSIDFKDELKDVLFKKMHVFEIDNHHAEYILSFLDEKHGFDCLFDFVKKRVALSLKGDEYKYLSLREYSYKGKKLSGKENISRFIEVTKWFVENYSGSQKDYEYLVNFFQPTNKFSEQLQEEILTLEKQFDGDFKRLRNLTTVVNILGPATESQIITLFRLVEACIQNAHDKGKVSDFVSSDFFYMSGGIRARRGQPFPEDVAKRDLLRKIISQNSFLPEINKYLESCIKRLETVIEREIKRDTEGNDW